MALYRLVAKQQVIASRTIAYWPQKGTGLAHSQNGQVEQWRQSRLGRHGAHTAGRRGDICDGTHRYLATMTLRDIPVVSVVVGGCEPIEIKKGGTCLSRSKHIVQKEPEMEKFCIFGSNLLLVAVYIFMLHFGPSRVRSLAWACAPFFVSSATNSKVTGHCVDKILQLAIHDVNLRLLRLRFALRGIHICLLRRRFALRGIHIFLLRLQWARQVFQITICCSASCFSGLDLSLTSGTPVSS
jgi:hypothetical protein